MKFPLYKFPLGVLFVLLFWVWIERNWLFIQNHLRDMQYVLHQLRFSLHVCSYTASVKVVLSVYAFECLKLRCVESSFVVAFVL